MLRHHVAFDRHAVHREALDAPADAGRVSDADVIFRAPVAAADAVAFPVGGDARVNLQSFVAGLDAQDELRDGIPVPGRRARQPAVLGLAGTGGILAGNHLRIDVRLHLVQGAVDFFDVSGAYLAVVLPGTVAAAQHRFADDDPRVVVAEDARILLVPGRVGGYFAIFHHVAGEGRVVQHDAVLAVQAFLHRVQCLLHQSFLQSDARHGAPALRFDEDLSFLVLLRAYLVAGEVVGTQVPVAVPAMLLHGFHHLVHAGLGAVGFFRLAQFAAQLHVVASAHDEQAGNHQRFGLRAFRLVLRGLERFVRVPREAVQVQAVVPVRPADEGQPVWTEVLHHVVEGHAQVFEERYLRTRLIVVGHRFVQDAEVARLLDVGHRAEDEPHRVVVESAADVIVAAFRQRLVLVVAAAVGELRGGNVDDALAGTSGYLVHEAHEVLVGVAEAHAAADAALKEGSRAGHVERDHALVLVPDVDHAVQLLVAALQHVVVQQAVPVSLQFGKGGIHLLRRVQGGDGGLGARLVHQGTAGRALQDVGVGRLELLVLRVLHVAQQEDEVAALARCQFHFEVMRGDGAPAVGDAVRGASGQHVLRVGKFVVEADEALAVRVEALDGRVDAVVGVVVAAFLVFRFVVDDRAFHLHLAGREVTLEVLHVRGGIPQAPFGEGEQLQPLHRVARVAQGQFLHLGPCLQGDEEQHAGFHAVLGAGDARVAHAVAALVAVQRCLARFPAGRPHRVAVLDVEVASAVVHGHAVIAVARDAAELGILVEAVASGRIGYQGEEIFIAQVVDPGPGRLRVGDDVFAVRVVKVTVLFVFHTFGLFYGFAFRK